MIVETMGKSLEETAALFDGEEIHQAIVSHDGEVRHDDKDYDEKASGSVTPPHEKA